MAWDKRQLRPSNCQLTESVLMLNTLDNTGSLGHPYWSFWWARCNCVRVVKIRLYKYYTATAIPFIYSFSGNSGASAPISTFMCLWAIYIFPWSVHIFPPAEKADPSWEYIIRSQTHECGNWKLGLRPRYSFSGNICFKFSAFCLCSV